MEVSTKHVSLWQVGLSLVTPSAWILYHLSNRDPWIAGGLILVTLVCAPLSLIALRRHVKPAFTIAWVAVAVNLVLFLLVALPLGWSAIQMRIR